MQRYFFLNRQLFRNIVYLLLILIIAWRTSFASFRPSACHVDGLILRKLWDLKYLNDIADHSLITQLIAPTYSGRVHDAAFIPYSCKGRLIMYNASLNGTNLLSKMFRISGLTIRTWKRGHACTYIITSGQCRWRVSLELVFNLGSTDLILVYFWYNASQLNCVDLNVCRSWAEISWSVFRILSAQPGEFVATRRDPIVRRIAV